MADLIFCSATDVAIREAALNGALHVRKSVDRFGDDVWAIRDHAGTIETHLSAEDVVARLRVFNLETLVRVPS